MHTAGAKALGWDLVHRLGVVEEPVELMQSEGVGVGGPWAGVAGAGRGCGVGRAIELRPGLVFLEFSLAAGNRRGRQPWAKTPKSPFPPPYNSQNVKFTFFFKNLRKTFL